MKRLLRKYFKKNYLINQLMQIYSLLLVGIILLTVAASCVFIGRNNYVSLETKTNAALYQLDSYVRNRKDVMDGLYTDLVGSQAKFENLRNYMQMTPREYFEYTSKAWAINQTDINFPSLLGSQFFTFSDLDAIYLNLDELDYYLRADRETRNGRIIAGKVSDLNGLSMMRVIQDQYSGKPIGTLYGVFSSEAVLGSLAETMETDGIDSFIFNSSGDLMFSNSNYTSTKERKKIAELVKVNSDLQQTFSTDYFVTEDTSSGQATIVLLASKHLFWQKVLQSSLIMLSVGIIIAGILLIILQRTFKRYSKQVTSIVNVTESVSEGNLKMRIDTSHVQDELYDLASAINFMVGSLDQYIKDIYVLEIKQRDANMRALQSQINPHFLYNTLEYIRMYALSRQQEELADVVFAFSALLRNNTTQEKTTTLEKELSFCEKYVYLYQMRYPDRIAYHFTIDDALKKIVLPKFTIQPLIENYFVHGIDYTRNDNAVSVKVFKKETQVVIQVSDNGKGMDAEQLQKVREKLKEPDVDMSTSIGLRNVHERLQNYFGPSYSLEVESSLETGTKITIQFSEEGAFDNV
ncbi:sensor histidine kinase [Enterococcus songbeiensis]